MRRLIVAAIILVAACDSPQSAPTPTVSVTPNPTPPNVLAGTIQTIAGDGTAGYSGDGGPATAAHLNGPKSVAVDAQGNVYIGEAFSRVRKVTPDGTITTVAGTGTSGFSGEGGPAMAAMLTLPAGLAVDGAGTLYIADSYNFRVRKVTRNGMIMTVAGTGYVGPSPGMGGYSGDGGPATLARIGRPSGVALDVKGNLYVADADNGRVRMVTADGVIRTVAGPTVPGESQALDPAGVALDGAGTLFIADNAAGLIWKLSMNGTMTKLAGRGFPPGDSGNCTRALSAAFGQALSIAVDSRGDVYFADAAADKVRMINANGLVVSIAGSGKHGAFGAVGQVGDGGLATAAALGSPPSVAVDAQGNLYIADEANQRIRKVFAPWQAPVNVACG